MRSVFITILILMSVSFSDTAIQTDWSNGGGVPGPVTDWGNSYDVAYQIVDTGGSLQLVYGILTIPVMHIVDLDYNDAFSVYASDVDGDSDTDILGASSSGHDVSWWENTDGTGTIWIKHTVDGGFIIARSVHAADVDGDGDTDILGAAQFLGDITWWENTDGTGTAWKEHLVDDFFDGAYCVYTADVDGDGDTDVLGSSSTDNIAWWENTDGTGTIWIEHLVDNSFDYAISVYATDVDGDGDTDVLGAAGLGDDIAWWENTDGTGTSWTEHLVDGNFYGAWSVYATDVDGDGDADVLGAAYTSDEIAWWENTDGTGTMWTKHLVDDFFYRAYSVFATDLDGDEDTDVLGAAYGAHEITWWENTDGTGNMWTEHPMGSCWNAASVYATDVNGDGNTDILGAAMDDINIMWWDVIGFSPGTLESSILDAGTVDLWELFCFTAEEPTGTSVTFQLRSSNDYTCMGAWSDTVFTTNTDLSHILTDLTHYVQYRAILQTQDPAKTPVLNDVTISYTTNTGIYDTTTWDLAPIANPSFGSFAVQVSLPESAIVNLLLYDVTGRVIAQSSQELSDGEHSVSFNNLHEGVYFCTIHAGDFTTTERAVVLK